MRNICALLIVMSVLVTDISACPLRKHLPQLPVCRGISRRALENCVKDSIQWLKPYLEQGVPGLGIEPFKPYHIIKYYDIQSKTPFQGGRWIHNLMIDGLTDYVISDVKIPSGRSDQLEFQAHFPNIQANGNNHVNISIFHLVIPSETGLNVFLQDVNANVIMSGEYFMSAFEERYFEVMDVAVTLTYENIEIFLGRENPPILLQDALNLLVKEHLHTIMHYVLPKIEWNAANVIQDVANKIYLSCPARMFMY